MDPWEAYKKEKEAKNGGKGSVNPWEQYQTEHGSGQITKTPTQPLFGGGYQTQLQREQKAQSLIPGAAKFTLQSQQTLQNSGKLPANALGRSYVDKSNEAQAKLMEVTARANQQAAAHNDSYGMAKSYADNQRAQQNIRWNNQQIRSQAQINRKDPVYAMAQDYDREQLKWYKQAAEQARQFAEAKVNSAMERRSRQPRSAHSASGRPARPDTRQSSIRCARAWRRPQGATDSLTRCRRSRRSCAKSLKVRTTCCTT